MEYYSKTMILHTITVTELY